MISVSRAPLGERTATEIREIYEEYTLEETRVAMISDPENEYAWIQSNRTIRVEN